MRWKTNLRRSLAGTVVALVVGGSRLGSLAMERSSDPGRYYGAVRDIIQQNCQSCHHAGGVAPFALGTYDQVARRRKAVESAVKHGEMPPWHADQTGRRWANDRSLSADDRETLLSWLREGAPEGPPGERSAQRRWPAGWILGAPDTVVALGEAVSVPPYGTVPYQYVYIDTPFEEDRWIRRVELRGTAPSVLHHALVLLGEPIPGSDPASIRGANGVDPRFGVGLDGYFALYLPGHTGTAYPPGQAKLLPAGATLKLQIHYTPDGVGRAERLEIGFTFADDRPDHAVETGTVTSIDFVIPPGSRNYEVTAVHRFEEPVAITSFLPHMHLRGSAFRYELHYPDGHRETLLNVPHYDFNWQEEYIAEEPIEVPAGSWLRATGWFDNSRHNLANPDPTVPVSFGEQTYEEMMIGYYTYYAVDGDQHVGTR